MTAITHCVGRRVCDVIADAEESFPLKWTFVVPSAFVAAEVLQPEIGVFGVTSQPSRPLSKIH